MLILRFCILFFFTSCSLFRAAPNLKNQDVEKLITSIQLIGEGNGRLSFQNHQYVFGIESGLRENFDWILAASIPLHGEEVMILSDLKKLSVQENQTHSFEKRIEHDFKELNLKCDITPKKLMKEIRSLIRFTLSSSWGQKHLCQAGICELDGEKFLVKVEEKEIFITKLVGHESRVILSAKNLTESFFEQTEIRLYSNEIDSEMKRALFSLELFWKG